MAKRTKTQERIYMVLFMFGISVLFISVIAAVHLATRETVERNRSLFVKRSVLSTAGVTPPKTAKEVEALFGKIAQPIPKEIPKYYKVKTDDGEKIVLIQSGSGLWGEIIAHVGFNSDKKSLSGINFVVQSETPGLGARIAEPWFQKQFIGKYAPFVFVAEKTRSEKPTEFDAITGATVTTTAVKDIVNTAAKRVKELKSGGEK
ncbi:FMN-binding protein [bacterium]|nr:FMN-binding protein [bacterium]